MFLILVDTFSGWMDIEIMMETTEAHKVIDYLRKFMSNFGFINTIVTDNGPPFSGGEFKDFCKFNNIENLYSPPYHPVSNGSAERAVQTAKKALSKIAYDFMKDSLNVNLNKSVINFLFKHRNTPRSDDNKILSELVFKYPLMTELKQLRHFTGKYDKLIIPHDLFKVNDKVLVYRSGKKDDLGNWEPGVIKRQLSSLTFEVLVGTTIKVVHQGSLKSVSIDKASKKKGN